MYISQTFIIILSATLAAGAVIRSPSDLVSREPEPRVVNPQAVTGTTCTAKGTAINGHDINVALLSICGGISGAIGNCRGNPTSSVGASGTAKFTLNAVTAGQTMNISKGRWESCVAAARATCGDSPFTSTCIGGANGNSGNVAFALSKQAC